MRVLPSISAIPALALVLMLAACGGGDSTAPAPSNSDDAPDLAALDGGANLPGTMMSEAPTAPSGRAECRFSEESGRYNCAPITRDGLTFVRSFAFYDAGRNPQRHFDRLTTEATNHRLAVHGTSTREHAVVKVRKAADMTVSGQSGDEKQHTLNGTEIGVTNAEITSDRGARVIHTEFADATVNVVVAVPRARGSWPLSGQTIRARSVREGKDAASLSRPMITREVTTFNGTHLVRVQLTNPHGTFSCVRNLETGKLECQR